VKGLTIQERRVLIAILLALVVGATVRQWKRQGEGREGGAASESKAAYRTSGDEG